MLAGFIFNVLRGQRLPELLLPNQKHITRGLQQNRTLANHAGHPVHPARRKTNRKPSEIPLNTDEGLRAAYYIPDDAASYASLMEHVHQIDLLFPQWLHIDGASTDLQGTTQDGFEFPIFAGGIVHDPDGYNKVKGIIQQSHEDTEIFPTSTTSIPTPEPSIPPRVTCLLLRHKTHHPPRGTAALLHRLSRLSRTLA